MPSSLHTVKYDCWGIDYNSWTKSVSYQEENGVKTAYEPGLYWLWIGHSFKTLPRTYSTINFASGSNGGSITSRTSDGLAITLDVSFQYRVDKENVFGVFDKFADEYENVVVYVSSDVVRDVCSQYRAIEFFQNRSGIADEISQEVISTLSDIGFSVLYFQMRNVDLPDSYEDILQANEIQRQLTEKALYTQESDVVSAETATAVAEQTALVTVIEAEQTAIGIELEAQGNANRTKAIVQGYSQAYSDLQIELGLTNEEIISFVWMDAVIASHDEDKLIINLEKPDNLDL